MRPKKLEVSIVVVNYNTPELVAELIVSIRKHTAGVAYDIMVVDNGSEPARRFRSDPADSVRRSSSRKPILVSPRRQSRSRGEVCAIFALRQLRLSPDSQYPAGNGSVSREESR